jgi:hypothetical protein
VIGLVSSDEGAVAKLGRVTRPATDWLAARPRLARVLRVVGTWLLFLAVPFVMIWRDAPFLGHQTFGNDYTLWSPAPQIEIVWAARSGTFPLYMPGFAIGHSIAAMTLAQTYHPITWLSAVMPGYGDGLALEWNTLFRYLSLGVTHLVLFRFLRRLGHDRWVAFTATLPAVYNLRMLDSFRYGASLEGYTAMLLLSATAGFTWIDADKRRPVAWVALSTYLLVVSGHPQWAYLAALAAGIFAVSVPWIARALGHATAPSRRAVLRYLGRLVVGTGSGVLLSLPYTLTFYFEVLRTNHARAESTYEWTLDYADSLQGELANFFLPLHADVHGAFGGSVLFLLVAMLPVLAFTKSRPPKVLWVLYAAMVTAFLFAIGKDGPGDGWVHRFFVHHVPGFGVFRVPGRVILWLPALMWPILVWLLMPANRGALLTVAGSSLVVLASRWFWGATGFPPAEYTSPRVIRGRHLPPHGDEILLALGAGALLLLFVRGRSERVGKLLVFGTLVLTGISTWVCLRHGTWVTEKVPTQKFATLTAWTKTSASVRDVAGDGLDVRGVTEYRARHLGLHPPLATIAHYATQLDDGHVFDRVGRLIPTHIFIDTPPVPLPSNDAPGLDQVKLVYNTTNRWTFETSTERDGYFVLGLPYIKGFVAEVDGVKTPVSRANALWPTFHLPKGAHRVDVRFVSTPFNVGVVCAFLTAAAWVVAAAWRRLRSRRQRVALFAGVALAGAVFGVGVDAWLYRGPSFGTTFTWSHDERPPPPPT